MEREIVKTMVAVIEDRGINNVNKNSVIVKLKPMVTLINDIFLLFLNLDSASYYYRNKKGKDKFEIQKKKKNCSHVIAYRGARIGLIH